MAVKVKLTEAQIGVLVDLSVASPRGAYPGLNMATLAALNRRGLVSRETGPGAFYSPKTAIRWGITDAGRRALAEHEGEG